MGFKKDELGNRMKNFYENRTRILLPRRTYTIIRVDGKKFSKYTKGLVRPFDEGLVHDMDETAKYLCQKIQGAKMAFVQSDEISIVLTDFDKLVTDAWFDGNVQKIVSISASMATAKFNQLRYIRIFNDLFADGGADDIKKAKLAEFDSRTFTIPSKSEVMNYLTWRQQDTVRNSVSSVAQSLYSPKQLDGKNGLDQKKMILDGGLNWDSVESKLRQGRFIIKREVIKETPYVDFQTQQVNYRRNIWVSEECPIFSQDQDFLSDLLISLE